MWRREKRGVRFNVFDGKENDGASGDRGRMCANPLSSRLKWWWVGGRGGEREGRALAVYMDLSSLCRAPFSLPFPFTFPLSPAHFPLCPLLYPLLSFLFSPLSSLVLALLPSLLHSRISSFRLQRDEKLDKAEPSWRSQSFCDPCTPVFHVIKNVTEVSVVRQRRRTCH